LMAATHTTRPILDGLLNMHFSRYVQTLRNKYALHNYFNTWWLTSLLAASSARFLATAHLVMPSLCSIALYLELPEFLLHL
jgi:hypothetical protein